MHVWKFYTFWAFCMHLAYWACPRYMPNTFLVAVFVWLGAEVMMRCVIVDHYEGAWATALHGLTHVLPVFVTYAMSRGEPVAQRTHWNVLVASLVVYLGVVYGFDVSRMVNTYRHFRRELIG